MKRLILAALLLATGFGVQAQTLTINNHTACPVNVYYFEGNSCSPVCGKPGGIPYVAGAYSIGVLHFPCNKYKQWAYAALNTNPNTLGYADGCEVGIFVDDHKGGCGTVYSGSFYVVSCGSFVNVTWTANTPTPGDVTIDIN
ncbi:MAG: hypothetical protein JST27_00130 [Bacteroidetes bacterium]|nr:hypothetical protein [Bacteroidota bacterium]